MTANPDTSDHSAILDRLRADVEAAADPVAAMEAVVNRLRAELPDYTWAGIYLMEGGELVLGPFSGAPSPHTRIPLHRGICGAAASEGRTIVVDDVHADPRYLACSLETRSEIVVPIVEHGRVLGEIDIDSDRPAAFGGRDRALLESLAALLAPRLGTRARS
jgi:GAF domain-containing protein